MMKMSSENPTFADLTTFSLGGIIERFTEPNTRAGFIEAIEEADHHGLPLLVIGGGSNMLASDDPFLGSVIRYASYNLTVPDEVEPADGGHPYAHIEADAGCNWDDLVAFAIELGFSGMEGLSGIPGTVGASVVQNIGAYGQEVASSVESVQVWDRVEKQVRHLPQSTMRFSYRSSLLKESMYQAPGVPADIFFPTPRYVVIAVTFKLRHSLQSEVGHGQLAHALHVNPGDAMPTADIRASVLALRASKGMLEDYHRYNNPFMAATKRTANLKTALAAQESRAGETGPDFSRHSCGSFFMNPVLRAQEARGVPVEAPKFDILLPDGSHGIKLSAAWLIDHAGFHKGFSLSSHSPVSLSPLHTLSLVNRGGGSSRDVQELARAIEQGVDKAFGIHLIPEPVLIATKASQA